MRVEAPRRRCERGLRHERRGRGGQAGGRGRGRRPGGSRRRQGHFRLGSVSVGRWGWGGRKKQSSGAGEASQKKVAASQKSKARPLRAPQNKGRDLPEKQKSKASCEKSKRDPLIFLLPACGIANNDWWLEEATVDLIAPYWAEVSLRVAERVLHDHVGLSPPAWLDAEYFRKSVMGI